MIAFHKMCITLTYCSSWKRCDVMRLPFIKCGMSLTRYQSQKKMCWDCLSQNVQYQYHPLPVGHRKRCVILPSTKIFNVAHILWVIYIEQLFRNICNVTYILGKICIMSCFGPLNQKDMLLACYGHRKRYDCTAFHETCNITHNLHNKTSLSKLSCSRVASVTHFLLKWSYIVS